MRCALILALFTLACSHAAPAAGPKPAAAPTSAAPTRDEACYAGTSAITSGGAVVATLPMIVHRTVDPSTATIVEEILQITEQGVETYVVDLKVTGDQVTLTERKGVMTGTGTLTGTPWAWDAWTTTSTLNNGLTVVSTDTRDATTLKAHKEARQGAQVVVTVDDTLTRFACAELEARRAELAPH
jgi:hypothetical protein